MRKDRDLTTQERVITALEDLAEDGLLPTVRAIRVRAQIGSLKTVMTQLVKLKAAGLVRTTMTTNGRPSYSLVNFKCPVCANEQRPDD